VTPQAFLELLWQFKPEDLYVLIWTYPGKRSHWFRDIAKAAACVASSTDSDIYLGVGLSKTDLGPACRCPSDEIAGIAGLWADFDLRSEAHGNKPLPPTIQDALSVIPASMPPTIVISTGNGAHAWWLLKEPYIFDDADDRKETASLVSRWHTLLRLNSAARGWAFDRLSDLARVLRIPGTRNLKDPRNPKDVSVYSFKDRRYNLSDFEELLDEAAIPDAEAREKAAREWAERFADKPPAINLDARIPQDILDGWMETDLRFKNTWLRQRHDLKDQSQSGYDLALADFGVAAGLPEQQIIDLIVHHRSTHHPYKQRTRGDYYQRTIAKALRRTDAPACPPAAPSSPDSGAADQSPVGASVPDPEHAKGILCERISATLGVRILRLVKITGKEPTFHMDLEVGGKIEFDSIQKFANQKHVHYAVAAATGKFTRWVKPKEWEELKQMMQDACFVEEGSVEEEFEGGARTYVAEYLSETPFIESIENEQVQNQKRPMVKYGRIAVNATDLAMYVNKTHFKNITPKAVASMLRAMGAEQKRECGRKFKEQSRWLLPADQFDPADYPAARAKEATEKGQEG